MRELLSLSLSLSECVYHERVEEPIILCRAKAAMRPVTASTDQAANVFVSVSNVWIKIKEKTSERIKQKNTERGMCIFKDFVTLQFVFFVLSFNSSLCNGGCVLFLNLGNSKMRRVWSTNNTNQTKQKSSVVVLLVSVSQELYIFTCPWNIMKPFILCHTSSSICSIVSNRRRNMNYCEFNEKEWSNRNKKSYRFWWICCSWAIFSITPSEGTSWINSMNKIEIKSKNYVCVYIYERNNESAITELSDGLILTAVWKYSRAFWTFLSSFGNKPFKYNIPNYNT
jgi:hypothetical protein